MRTRSSRRSGDTRRIDQQSQEVPSPTHRHLGTSLLRDGQPLKTLRKHHDNHVQESFGEMNQPRASGQSSKAPLGVANPNAKKMRIDADELNQSSRTSYRGVFHNKKLSVDMLRASEAKRKDFDPR